MGNALSTLWLGVSANALTELQPALLASAWSLDRRNGAIAGSFTVYNHVNTGMHAQLNVERLPSKYLPEFDYIHASV